MNNEEKLKNKVNAILKKHGVTETVNMLNDYAYLIIKNKNVTDATLKLNLNNVKQILWQL